MTQGLLYQNVATQIKQDILKGVYPIGSLLPTEVQLEAMFDVSKVTVRKAVQILSDEGYVVKKSGKGTRVVSNRLFNKLSKAVSYSTILEKNHSLDKELVSYKLVELEKESELYELLGSEAHCLTRIYNLDGIPFIYFEHYFPVIKQSEEDALKEIDKHSIYRWLSNHGYDVAHFEDHFKVKKVNDEIKRTLNLEDNHLLVRKRISQDPTNRVVEVSYGHYNSDVKPYIIEYEI